VSYRYAHGRSDAASTKHVVLRTGVPFMSKRSTPPGTMDQQRQGGLWQDVSWLSRTQPALGLSSVRGRTIGALHTSIAQLRRSFSLLPSLLCPASSYRSPTLASVLYILLLPSLPGRAACTVDTSALIHAIHVPKRSSPRQADSACQE
jgi:hypothetical protein